MIVLITGSSRGPECAAAIEAKTHQKTQIAASLAAATEHVQRQDAEALVIDESFQQVESGIEHLVEAHAGTAVPIYVNLSLHGANRVAQDVSCAMQRLLRERSVSVRAVASELRSELRGEITAILLNAELALRERELPPCAAEKLRVIQDLAERMRRKLDAPRDGCKPMPLKPRLAAKQPGSLTAH